jgi:hypothetical protein
MTLAEKQMILNRKIDRDLSTNIFLMRIIRKYLEEHKAGLTGVWGHHLHSEPPHYTTNTSNTMMIGATTTAIGGGNS